MVNTLKKKFSPHPVGIYGKLTMWSIPRRHQVIESKGVLEAEHVWALRVLRSLGCKKKLVAEKRRETHPSNGQTVQWIEDHDERETAGAKKRVEDAEDAITQEQEDTETAENAGLKTREPKNTFHEMMVAIGDSLSNIATSDNGEDGEDQDDDDAEQGKLSEDDEPSHSKRLTVCTFSICNPN